MALSWKRENINKRIDKIFQFGLTPSTAKSVASSFSNILYDRGTAKEGYVRTFSEAKQISEERYKELGLDIEYTREEYNKELKELVNDPMIQTSLKSTINYAYNTMMNNINYLSEYDEELYDRLSDLSPRDLVSAVLYANDLGHQASKEGYGSSGAFISGLEQWLGDRGK